MQRLQDTVDGQCRLLKEKVSGPIIGRNVFDSVVNTGYHLRLCLGSGLVKRHTTCCRGKATARVLRLFVKHTPLQDEALLKLRTKAEEVEKLQARIAKLEVEKRETKKTS